MSKYRSPSKAVDELTEAINLMSSAMEEFARWEAYRSIKENPLQFNEKTRKDILEHSKGHITHTLYLSLFRAYPLRPENAKPTE